MSVYRKRRRWHYDFVLRGRRYYGSTGQETRRAAEAVERARRLEAALGISGRDASGLTLDEAAGKYQDEKDPRREDPNLDRCLRVMLECVGKHLLLREIDAAVIAEAIAKRRGMAIRWRPAPATVNREIIDVTLRPMLNRARKAWGAKGMTEISWRDLRLKEPKGIVREYSAKEVDAWRAALAPSTVIVLDLMLTYGLRLGEVFFLPAALDAEAKRLTLSNRKAGDTLTLPLREEHARLLAAMSSTRKPDEPVIGLRRGQLVHALRSAAKKAGLQGGRLIHGTRHHAGTTILRATGNLKLTQRMLGHATIQSTMRYAHATDNDLREALDALPQMHEIKR